MPTTAPSRPRHLADVSPRTLLLESVARTTAFDLPARAPRHRARPAMTAPLRLPGLTLADVYVLAGPGA